MNQEAKLHMALIQIHNLTELLSDGPYFAFFTSHLLPIKYELERQLSCLTNSNNSTKIEQ